MRGEQVLTLNVEAHEWLAACIHLLQQHDCYRPCACVVLSRNGVLLNRRGVLLSRRGASSAAAVDNGSAVGVRRDEIQK